MEMTYSQEISLDCCGAVWINEMAVILHQFQLGKRFLR